VRGGNPLKTGCDKHPTRVRKLVTQGFLALSFPLFRPLKVCTASWTGGVTIVQIVPGM
jgi:hypothetical protein